LQKNYAAKKFTKKQNCEHYAHKPLFYKTPSVLFIFGHFSGQKKMSISKKFSNLFSFFFLPEKHPNKMINKMKA
jgi:hypothetical protein